MEYSVLPKSGLKVSRICLGSMTFGNPIGESECCRLVAHALDRGVCFFDTANIYEGYDRTFGSAGGVGEELLGAALQDRRQEAVICTKFGSPVGKEQLDAGLSRKHLDAELTKSLRRLRTDRIDVVLAHRWEAAFPAEELLRTFDDWVRAGKVVAVGVSNWPAWRQAQVGEMALREGLLPISVNSPRYNLLNRAIEVDQVPCALHYGMALLPYQPLQGGVLAGKYRRGMVAPPSSRGAEHPAWLPTLDDALFHKLEVLEKLSANAGFSMAGYSLAWLLSRPAVSSVVVGCRTVAQLDTILGDIDKAFPAGHSVQIDEVFSSPKPASGEQVLRWTRAGWALDDLEELPHRG
jgi:L-glyceraldehyde 3-phosphate reductase